MRISKDERLKMKALFGTTEGRKGGRKGCVRSERDGLLPTAVTKEDAAGPQRIS